MFAHKALKKVCETYTDKTRFDFSIAPVHLFLPSFRPRYEPVLRLGMIWHHTL
jgi:hypothetical protein